MLLDHNFYSCVWSFRRCIHKMIWYNIEVMYLKPLFNTLFLRFFHAKNILLGSVQVLWKINEEVHSLKDVNSRQKAHYVVADLLWWKKWFLYWSIRYTNLSAWTLHKERMCIYASIKCSNGLKLYPKLDLNPILFVLSSYCWL